MTHTTKSLREFLLGNLTDFSEACGIPRLVGAKTLAALVTSLANYQEEGARLLPELYLCSDIDAALQLIPSVDKLYIGTETEPVAACTVALKKCAPLARDGWCIYISKAGRNFDYGLFRGSLYPLALSVERTFFADPLETINIVRLHQTASNCVEIRNSKGESRSIILTDKPENIPHPREHVTQLADSVCGGVAPALLDITRNFMLKALSSAIAESHGTIVVVTKEDVVPDFLEDGITLRSPLNFQSAIEKFQQGGLDANEIQHSLIANTALLKGMVSSDGITVFSQKATLLAYNCFISAEQAAAKVNGGARTRAFEALKRKLAVRQLAAVFVRSQDGWTKFERR